MPQESLSPPKEGTDLASVFQQTHRHRFRCFAHLVPLNQKAEATEYRTFLAVYLYKHSTRLYIPLLTYHIPFDAANILTLFLSSKLFANYFRFFEVFMVSFHLE